MRKLRATKLLIFATRQGLQRGLVRAPALLTLSQRERRSEVQPRDELLLRRVF